MSSVLRPVRKRKKGRTLGRVDILRREDYAALELDPKVELIRSLVPLGLMHVEEWLDEEVTALAGARYARKDGSTAGRRSRCDRTATTRPFRTVGASGRAMVIARPLGGEGAVPRLRRMRAAGGLPRPRGVHRSERVRLHRLCGTHDAPG